MSEMTRFSAYYGEEKTWHLKLKIYETVQISFERSTKNKIFVRLSEPWKVSRLVLALTQ